MFTRNENGQLKPLPELLKAFLDSLRDPFVFVDTDHIIRYMNQRAIKQYKAGNELLNRSLMECHNEKSQQIIKETLKALQDGEDERLIHASASKRLYMRAVRDVNGRLLGYYERFEFPAITLKTLKNNES